MKKYSRRRMPVEEAKARRKIRYKKWYDANKSYFKERMKNPKTRMSVLVRTRVYNAVKRFYVNNSKSAPTAALIGCSMEELKKHLESKFRDGMTWENYGPFWHIDHIIPCASFDLTDPQQQRQCFSYRNLQPLLKAENLRKNKYAN